MPLELNVPAARSVDVSGPDLEPFAAAAVEDVHVDRSRRIRNPHHATRRLMYTNRRPAFDSHVTVGT